jgi:hypothetical protein
VQKRRTRLRSRLRLRLSLRKRLRLRIRLRKERKRSRSSTRSGLALLRGGYELLHCFDEGPCLSEHLPQSDRIGFSEILVVAFGAHVEGRGKLVRQRARKER